MTLEQVEELLARLEASAVDGDREALMQLWDLGPEAAAGVPALLARLNDEASALRALAARWLGSIGARSSVVAAALADAMGAEDPELRHAAIRAVGDVGVPSEAVVARLRAALGADDAIDRVSAARSLLLLAPNETAPLQVLRAARASADYRVRDWAASSLRDLEGTVDVIELAFLFLDDPYDPTVETVASVLARGPAERVVRRLCDVVRSGSPRARAGSLVALRRFGVDAAPFRDVIVSAFVDSRALERDDHTVCRLSANAATAVGLDAPIVVRKLAKRLRDADDWLAEQAAEALLSFPSIPDELREHAAATLERVRGRPRRSPEVAGGYAGRPI